MIPALGSREDKPPAPRQRPRSILVLDEAQPVRSALTEILHKLGVARDDIRVATTAEEAIALFKADAPTVVFTELVGVHAEEGLEVIHEMLERSPECKIVLVTAESRDAPEVRAAIRSGVFAYVDKPLRHDKIRQVLQDLAAEEGGIERFR